MKNLGQEIGKSVTKKSEKTTPLSGSRVVASRKDSNRQLSSRKKKIILFCGVGAGVLIVAALIFFLWINKSVKFGNTTLNKPVPSVNAKFYSPLTGLETTETKTTAPVTAVMIENSPDARPQSGLKDAGVVFEAVAEGGITRFIALYQEAEPKLIGPVRSVRSYYLEWADAFDPAVAHVGGSYDALSMVRGGKYGVDLDQFYNDSAYWRTNDRIAPHNVYTDYAHLAKLKKTKGKTSSEFTAWPRVDGKKTQKPTVTKIDLEPSSGLYSVHYDYDAKTNTYKRSQGSEPHLDREKGRIASNVVVALRISEGLASDQLHSTFQTSGQGKAYVFQNGQVIQGRWQKANAKTQIKFVDNNGAEIKLNRGQVWITAVGQGRNISWQ